MLPPVVERDLYPIRRDHLDAISGPLGIWQHADGSRPDESFGYCTDDVARALTVDLLHGAEIGWTAVRASAWRSLRFLGEAYVTRTGRFRNFRTADGTWLEADWSEDCHGRALRALGLALTASPEWAFEAESRALFQRALSATHEMRSVRATASALLGCSAAIESEPSSQTRGAFAHLARALESAFASQSADAAWPWPEPRLTYENGLPAEALIRAGAGLGDSDLLRTGLSTLDWLVRIQTGPTGFVPVGNDGWWARGGSRPLFDQQPIEATSTILAATAAFEVTRDERYLETAERAYGWFLGDNVVGVPVADPATGGCHDGLTPTGVNLNRGAESTLMWQVALETVRAARSMATDSMPASMPETAGGRR
jgi:hypothetical protein